MKFLNKIYYHNQIIKFQFINERHNKHFIITHDEDTNRYTLWENNKKIATSKDVFKLYERMDI